MISFLDDFYKANRFRGKGPLSVALVVTDHARISGIPLNPDNLITGGGGQVLGLGQGKVQAILARHGITRILAKECGRTSRGSIANMRTYVAFLNDHPEFSITDVEEFWINRVRDFFTAKPFTLRLDGALGLRAVVRSLMRQAEERQREMPGNMFLGTMMQHLVGAKLSLVLGRGVVEQHGSNENDEADNRTGDFETGDVSIHVSTAPGEALMRKCSENIDIGRKPIIVTTSKGAMAAEVFAEKCNITDRIDIVEFEQFIATNIYELGRFVPEERRLRIDSLLQLYNEIIDTYETDPSLKIELSKGR